MNTAIYARVSTDEQKNGKTIHSQLEELRRYAKEKKYNIIKEYIDEGVSGATLIRPELNELRKDAHDGKFETVLVYHVDRLARDSTFLGMLIKELSHSGVKVHFKQVPMVISDSEDDENPMTDFIISSFGGVAQLERALIKKRTLRGRKYKAEVRQLIIGHKAPYGYQYVKKDKENGKEGYYKVIPEEAKIVKLIFEWMVKDGLSAYKIVRRLTSLKIPTRSGNSHWAKSTVLRIIKNETYCGVTYYNKHKVTHRPEYMSHLSQNGFNTEKKYKTECHQRAKEQWIPIPLPKDCHIISRKTWELAQEQLKKNTAFSPRNTKHKYLLQGLVRCNKCHSPFTGQVSKRSQVYRCGNRFKRYPLPRNCYIKSANKEILENLVWKSVVSAIQNPKILQNQINRLKKKYSDSEELKKELLMINNLLKKKQEEEKRLIDALQAGVLSLNQIKTKIECLKKEKERFSKEKLEIESRIQKTNYTSIDNWSIQQWCQAVKKRISSLGFEEKQTILRQLLNGIFIDDSKVIIKGKIPLHDINKGIKGKNNHANHQESVPVFADTFLAYCGRNTTMTIPIEITKPLPRKINQFKIIVHKH